MCTSQLRYRVVFFCECVRIGSRKLCRFVQPVMHVTYADLGNYKQLLRVVDNIQYKDNVKEEMRTTAPPTKWHFGCFQYFQTNSIGNIEAIAK